MREQTKNKWTARLDVFILRLLLLTALVCCVSEPLARNLIRISLAAAAVRLFLDASPLCKLKEYRALWAALSATFVMLTLSAIYGGNISALVANGDFRCNYYVLIVPLVVLFVPNLRKLRLMFLLMMFSLFMVDCHVIYQWHMGNVRPTSWIHASFMLTGMFYCLLLPVTVAFAVKEDETKFMRRLFAALAFVGFAALILTGTRAALITAVSVCPLMLLISAKDKLKTLFFVGIGFFVLAAAAQGRLQVALEAQEV